jgi:hypothetical protein
MPIALHWNASALAGCFRAVEALFRSQQLADPALAEVLAEPADRLLAALHDEGIPAESFLSHIIPLAAGTGGLHQISEVALIRTIGRTDTPSRLRRFWDLLTDLKTAFTAAQPRCAELLPGPMKQLEGRWNAHGVGILGGVITGTEPGVLVEEAMVVVAPPILGGGGAAYLPYNVALVETVVDDPTPELPEVVRLAWLLAMLNLDLPRYSENIRPDRRATVAALAMLPIVLTAAADVRLASCDEAAIQRAVEVWLPLPQFQNRTAAEWAALLVQWHATFRDMRPPLGQALMALDVLMGE